MTADRYQGLVGQNAVSQQDTDNAASQLQARDTEVTSAQANVRSGEELQSFERITAPFDGVVTARNLDIGQLITRGWQYGKPRAATEPSPAVRSSTSPRSRLCACSSMCRRSMRRTQRTASSRP